MDKQLESNEFDQLKELVEKRRSIEQEMAQLELHKVRKVVAYEAVMTELGDFQAGLHSKYGDVKINMQTGQIND